MERLTEKSVGTLIDQIADLRAQNAALHRRVEFLEMVLAQRVEVTQVKYQERKSHFSAMGDLVYRIFLDNPAKEFTYAEVIAEWNQRYPNLESAAINAPRRVRELEVAGRLWRSVRKSDGLAIYWLKLDEKPLER
jgi:hypothetical protein